MEYALKLENVTKKYKDFKLDNVNIGMPKGCFNIVVSKYILGLFFLTVAFVITMLFSLLFSNLNLTENILSSFAILSAGIIIISVIFPILFKFGVEKGRILMMIVLFAPTGIIVILSKLGLEMPSFDAEILKLIIYLSPVFALVLFSISVLISLSIYKNKEF